MVASPSFVVWKVGSGVREISASFNSGLQDEGAVVAASSPTGCRYFLYFLVAQVFLGSSYLLVTEKTEKLAAQSHFQ